MKRPLASRSPLLLLVCSLACLTATQAQTDSRKTAAKDGVPLLSDIPVLGHLFKNQKKLWYPLDDHDTSGARDFPPPASSTEPAQLPFRERWLLKTLKERFAGVRDIHVVEHVTSRFAGDQRTITVRRGLEIFGEPTTLPKVKAWLDGFMALRSRMVVIEFKLVRSSEARKQDEGKTTTNVQLLTRNEFHKILAHAETDSHITIIGTPTLTISNGQRANVSVVSQTSYVKDYDIQVLRGAAIADPIIDVVTEGIVIDVTPVLDPEQGRLSLETSVQISNLERPIKEVTLSPAKPLTGKLTIQLPCLSISEWKSDGLELPEESWFRVTGLSVMDDDWSKGPMSMEVLAHVRVVELDEVEVAPRGEVIGVDRSARRAFVLWPEDEPRRPEVTEHLAVWREKKQVGELVVLEQTGRITICRPVDIKAAFHVGDHVTH